MFQMNELSAYLNDPRVIQYLDSLRQQPNQFAQNIQPQQSPPNYFRNNETGNVVEFGPSQPMQQPAQIDYSQPQVEVIGGVKGYRAKNDPSGIYDQSGNKLSEIGFNRNEKNRRLLEDLNIQNKMLDTEKKRFDLAAAQDGNVGNVPAGYRRTQTGNLEAIPGGPADIKAGIEGDKRKRNLESSLSKADLILGSIDTALVQSNPLTTGLVGDARATGIGRLTGSGAYDLRRTIDTIKSNIGFQELQAMREASPTGGALGQVAVKELDFLQSTLGNIDAGQSEEQLDNNLKKIKTHYNNWKNAVSGKLPNQSPSGIDQQALEWANANPNDPRAAKIRQRLGM